MSEPQKPVHWFIEGKPKCQPNERMVFEEPPFEGIELESSQDRGILKITCGPCLAYWWRDCA